jgi:glycosyltransferase involved in cell wall biosynthesis
VTRILFAIPGDIAARTGGYEYDRQILRTAPGFGARIVHLPLQGAFPDPSGSDVAAAVEKINLSLEAGDVLLMDGLACGALPVAALRNIRAPVIELCHHPLCLEAGLAEARADELRENESRIFAQVAHVVVTSEHTRMTLEGEFGVPAEKISVAPPGTEPAARASGTKTPPTLLALGSLIPRKAFDILVEALAGLVELDWRLKIVGSRDHAPATATALDALVIARGPAARIELSGERSGDALREIFDSADVFVSSSLYEGYGMALAEALARGLPIVMTTGGAAAETVPDAAALKVAPGDVDALRSALRKIVADERLRRRLSEGAWRAGQCLPRWEDAARIVVDAARKIGGRQS